MHRLFGPTDLTTILQQSTPHGLDVRVPALNKMIGRPTGTSQSLIQSGFLVNKESPFPTLFTESDNQVPINQSKRCRMGQPCSRKGADSHPALFGKRGHHLLKLNLRSAVYFVMIVLYLLIILKFQMNKD